MHADLSYKIAKKKKSEYLNPKAVATLDTTMSLTIRFVFENNVGKAGNHHVYSCRIHTV